MNDQHACQCPRNPSNLNAASFGCGICGGAIQSGRRCGMCQGQNPPPSGDPFQDGPYRGRYWCSDCWSVYWSEHPEHLADEATRQFVAQEAARIRNERGQELLHQEGENRVYLTGRGSIIIMLQPMEGFGLWEFHPDQYQALLRAMRELDRKEIPGFRMNPEPSSIAQ